MKILGLRIYTKGRIKKVCQLIDGIPEDREIAKHFLNPITSEKKPAVYPKYRIKVVFDRVYLQKKVNILAYWDTIMYRDFSFREPKELAIRYLKGQIRAYKGLDAEQKASKRFKKYYIKV